MESAVKVTSMPQLVERSNQLLAAAYGRKESVHLVVPHHEWGQARKLQLRSVAPLGVRVLTLPQLVEQLWDLHGDGRSFVTELQRKVLLRPLVAEMGVLESSPSAGLVSQLADFVREAVGAEPDSQIAFSESESRIMRLVEAYGQRLESEGLIEPVQAQRLLVSLNACADMHLVFEAPDLNKASTRSFIEDVKPNAKVTVFEQAVNIDASAQLDSHELEDVRKRLFTGLGGVKAQGHVRVGVARGSHVEANVVAQLVKTVHEEAQIAHGDIAIALASVSEAYPQLLHALATASIPFSARFSVPLARTGLGAAFIALEELAHAPIDDDSFEAAVDFINSPYAGVPSKDARALQMRWRERSHSSQAERILDIRGGFEQGNAQAKVTKERLAPLAQLLDMPLSERVSTMFDHAKQAGSNADALIDDAQAAEALLSYLETCESLDASPSFQEISNIPVSLTRAFGDQEDAVSIISTQDIGPRSWQSVIVAGFDATRYPMAAQDGSFEPLMEKLGINRTIPLAQTQRIMLLNALEATQECFAFSRPTHNAQGDESCQSALFEELVAVYRTPQDDEDDLPVQGIPKELEPWERSLSEADELLSLEQEAEDVSNVMRGFLDSQAVSTGLLHDPKGRPIVFSPTALEDYYRCPYRWFTSRRVAFRGMDTVFDVAAQGNLVHAVLERFYKDLKRAGYERVTPLNLEEALAIASKAFDAQVEKEGARDRRGVYLKTQGDKLACEELRACVLALVERDAEFLPGFTPTYFELELGSDDAEGVVLEYAGVPVRGKVDRIDVDSNGNAVIIDYKLSSLASGYGLGPGESVPERLQTDIYATLVQRYFNAKGIDLKVVGSVYRSYASNRLRGIYDRQLDWGAVEEVQIAKDGLPKANSNEVYEDYLQRIEDVMGACIDRLEAGDIQPAPLNDDVCKYCAGELFCPRRES